MHFFWKSILVAISLTLAVPRLLAQEDTQFRLLIHPTVDIAGVWFLPVWAIATAAAASPDNANLLTGIGFRGGSWWAEALTQRHWNAKGTHQWFLNFRLRKEFGAAGPDRGRMVFYLEPTMVLTQRGFAESRVLGVPLDGYA